VEQKSPAAGELLRPRADLSPEEIVTWGSLHQGSTLSAVGADPSVLNGAIEALQAFSL